MFCCMHSLTHERQSIAFGFYAIQMRQNERSRDFFGFIFPLCTLILVQTYISITII